MAQFVRIETTILPGRRIEITSPDLPESGPVEVLVVVPRSADGADSPPIQTKPTESIVEFLERLPVRHHSPSWWAELDAALTEERNSWDR